MSATMTMTAVQPPKALSKITSTPCCPNCGNPLPSLAATDPHAALLEAQRRIADLEAQVRLLNQKATAAVDRWADYEDELSRLRTESRSNSVATGAGEIPTPSSRRSSSANPAAAAVAAAPGRISQLLSPRNKSLPNVPGGHTPQASVSSSMSTDDLLQALNREQSLRMAAEAKVNDTSREVEELSVTLFEQANEMVATERRARAKLEERVSVLEKRDVEKKGRLERLEGAMTRIERVRSLLGEN